MILGLTAPLWLAKNWKPTAAAIVAALATTPIAYCTGRHDGSIAASAKAALVAQKIQTAAAKAEAAANLTDMTRQAKSVEQIRELKEIVNETGTDAAVGPAVSAVLDRMRRAPGNGDAPSP